jgi:hypothetical protein
MLLMDECAGHQQSLRTLSVAQQKVIAGADQETESWRASAEDRWKHQPWHAHPAAHLSEDSTAAAVRLSISRRPHQPKGRSFKTPCEEAAAP